MSPRESDAFVRGAAKTQLKRTHCALNWVGDVSCFCYCCFGVPFGVEIVEADLTLETTMSAVATTRQMQCQCNSDRVGQGAAVMVRKWVSLDAHAAGSNECMSQKGAKIYSPVSSFKSLESTVANEWSSFRG